METLKINNKILADYGKISLLRRMIIRPETINLATTWRHSLHQNPQLAGEEDFARDLIRKQLNSLRVPFEEMAGGIVAKIEGKTNTRDRAIGFRADMDALALQEEGDLPYKSINSGKMHACGHDGHTAMLLGAVTDLANTRDFDGTFYAIFQPAEETGRGAKGMIEAGLFKRHKMDAIFAYHVWPQAEAGTILISPGAILAAVDFFKVTFTGPGGHAGMRNKKANLVRIHAELVTTLDSMAEQFDPTGVKTVWSCTNPLTSHGDKEVPNIYPTSLTANGTVRTHILEQRQAIINEMQRIVAQANSELDYNERTTVTINDPQQTEICRLVATQFFGASNVLPFGFNPAGEDFSYMLRVVPGALLMLGQGTGNSQNLSRRGLHDPRFNFNDEIIPLGIGYATALVRHTLAPA